MIKINSTSKNAGGSGTKPKISLPSGVNGNANDTARIINILINSIGFGLLRKKGMALVLITNIISVWVKSDSTNHAVWKSGAVALKT